jgi:hypothetical protein
MVNVRRIIVRLILSIAAASTAQLLPAQATSKPAPGVLIHVNGHKLRLHCTGPSDASPTVVLEAGGGGSSTAWSRVQNLLRDRIRTCAYDRAGLG